MGTNLCIMDPKDARNQKEYSCHQKECSCLVIPQMFNVLSNKLKKQILRDNMICNQNIANLWPFSREDLFGALGTVNIIWVSKNIRRPLKDPWKRQDRPKPNWLQVCC